MNRKTNLKEMILATLDEHQAQGLCVLDVKPRCNFTDEMIIVSASSIRHLVTLSDAVAHVLKDKKEAYVVEGHKARESGWIVIDVGTMMVHLMLPEQRDFYNLETLWGPSGERASDHNQ